MKAPPKSRYLYVGRPSRDVLALGVTQRDVIIRITRPADAWGERDRWRAVLYTTMLRHSVGRVVFPGVRVGQVKKFAVVPIP
jgi:hypothetical protein